MTIYATSDIHGEYYLLKEMIEANIDFNKGDKLVLCGDYVDGIDTSNSFNTVNYIHSLYEKYPNQIIALLGNHDLWLLDWIYDRKSKLSVSVSPQLTTILDFMNQDDDMYIISNAQRKSKNTIEFVEKVSCQRKKYILENHGKVLEWIDELPLYYETKNQIFVHAGIHIIEGLEDYWKDITFVDDFLMQFPPDLTEYTHKTIISGHIGVNQVCNQFDFNNCYGYGNRIFLDSTVKKTRRLNLLKYDEERDCYTEIIKDSQNHWNEADIRWENKYEI